MASPSPPASRGEPAVVAGETSAAKEPRRLARRVRALGWLGRGFHALATAVALAVLLVVAALVEVVGHSAWPSILRYGPSFLTGTTWDPVHNSYGALPAIVGTLLTSALALLIAVPIALGVAVFLSEVAPAWLRRPITYVVDLSAAVPSVVYGFWAFIVLVPLMQNVVEPALGSASGGRFPFSSTVSGTDVLTATLVLAVMVLPTIAAMSREAMRAVPRIHRESALSLGATRWEATRMGVLAPARSGIVAGVILGLGRALGETIAVTMVIGNAYLLPGTLFSPGSTLASQIVSKFPGQGGIDTSAIMELALILLAITFGVNVVARGILWRFGPEDSGEAPRRRKTWLRRSHRRDSSLGSAARVDGASSLDARLGWRRDAKVAMSRTTRRRKVVQWVVVGLTAVCVLLAVVPLASVIYTAVQNGGSVVLRPSFYTSLTPVEGCNPSPGTSCSYGGIGNAIQGTLIVLGLAALIAVPVGLLAGIFLSEYGRNPLARLLSLLADVMTGVPTIILGLFMFTVFVYFDHAAALSALDGGVALGVLMIPIAIRGTEEALRAVPTDLRESALALGFPRHRVTTRVVLGCARGGLVTGMLLAASRAAGDTAVLFVTVGGSTLWFQGLTSPTAAMTPFIFSNFGSDYANLRADAWGAALVLLAIMLAIALATRLLVPESDERAGAG